MESIKNILKTKRYRLYIQGNFERLEVLRSEDDFKGFYAAFLETVPELRSYLNSLLKSLEKEGKLLPHFYEVNDFIDELFIIVYDSFKIFKDEDDFYIFLFVQLDLLIDRATLKEKEQHESMENLSDYEKLERDKMIEKMAAQLDGDIVLKEELDDISYHKGIDEHLTVFEVETEQQLDQKIDDEKIHYLSSKQVDELLKDLPSLHKNIAALYIHFHLTLPEIVQVTKESNKTVKDIIEKVKDSLKQNLLNI